MTNFNSPQKLSTIIFKNSAFAMGGNFALKLINFLFSVYVIRNLGDERYGQYSIVLGFVGLFQIFAELGMTQYVMREISRDRDNTQPLILNLVGARMLLAFVAIGIIPLAAMLYGYTDELVLGVFIYTSVFVLSALQAPLQALIIANERFDLSSVMNVIGQLTFVILGGLFLFLGFNFLSLIIAGLFGLIPQIIFGLWVTIRNQYLKFPLDFDLRSWPALMRAGATFGMISLAMKIAFGIDTVILSKFVSAAEVGWYNVAYGLVFSIMSLTRGFREAMVPSLTRIYVQDPKEAQRWYYRVVKATIMLTIPMALGGVLVADPLIRMLYTDEFTPVILAFSILIWDIPFLMFNSFSGNLTTVIGAESTAARINIINAISNVGLNLLFIPFFGYIAASIITVITDIIGSLQFHQALKLKLQLPSIRTIILKVSFASSIMGLCVWFARSLNLHLIILVSIGAIIYGIFILVMRVLDDTEWRLIRNIVRKIFQILKIEIS